MSIIEQAARRLEELRRGGIEVPVRATRRVEHPRTNGISDIPARAAGILEEKPPLFPVPASASARPTLHDVSTSQAPASASRRVEVDLAHLGALGYLTPDTPRARIADEFRVIKRPLLMNLQGQGAAPVDQPNLIMVTSAQPGEGKTFVSINLAISLAMELDKTVLLVDADVSRPALLPRLGLDPARCRGLLDVLEDPSCDLSSVLLRTNIDKLTLLPSGAVRGSATEMLASQGMSQLLAEMSKRYADRVIVFDAPPLLPSPESRVLATHMGQVVLVVGAGDTSQKAVARALSEIETCPVVMALLNKAPVSEIGAYYGYYAPGSA